jgi:hypothetical protein
MTDGITRFNKASKCQKEIYRYANEWAHVIPAACNASDDEKDRIQRRLFNELVSNMAILCVYGI